MVVHVSLMSHMLLHVLLSDCIQRCNIPMDWRCMHEILQVNDKKGHNYRPLLCYMNSGCVLEFKDTPTSYCVAW